LKTSRPPYSLAAAPAALRWAVTLFLATIGISYLFGMLMVINWVGLGPADIARAYGEADEAVADSGAAISEELPVNLDEVLGGRMEHSIDRELLLQDTHVHLPVYALIALALALIALGLRWPARVEMLVVIGLFTAPWVDFGGQWLVKLVAPGYSYMTVLGGWMMAGLYLVIAATALWQMWFLREDTRRQ
jgi:hypothetical protein